MKQTICSVLGVIGSAIASFFGGWDAGLATLLIFMGLDYISGLIVAGVFKNSPALILSLAQITSGMQ